MLGYYSQKMIKQKEVAHRCAWSSIGTCQGNLKAATQSNQLLSTCLVASWCDGFEYGSLKVGGSWESFCRWRCAEAAFLVLQALPVVGCGRWTGVGEIYCLENHRLASFSVFPAAGWSTLIKPFLEKLQWLKHPSNPKTSAHFS